MQILPVTDPPPPPPKLNLVCRALSLSPSLRILDETLTARLETMFQKEHMLLRETLMMPSLMIITVE